MGTRNAIESFSSRPTFGDVASGAGHDIGAKNAIENFLKATKLWRCCECRWSPFLVREMRMKVFSSPQSFGDVEIGASPDIGARNAIEIF